MSVEKAIREKQAFRDRVEEFLTIPTAMTNDEIEIALARLADMLGSAVNQHQHTNIQLKGTVLKYYFDLRTPSTPRSDPDSSAPTHERGVRSRLFDKVAT